MGRNSAAAPVIAGLLLAAGRGARFDAQGQRNKLLEPIDGEPVVLRSARQLRAAVDHLIVVGRPDSSLNAAAFAGLADLFSVCPDAALGMGHSLAHGVREARRCCAPDALLVALGDMPFVAAGTLQSLAALGRSEGGNALIAAPRYQGQRGHPVLFGRDFFDVLERCTGDTGAAALLRGGPVQWLEVDDPGVIRDIDRPEDLPASAT